MSLLDGEEIMLTEREVEILSIFISQQVFNDEEIANELNVLVRKLLL